MKVIKYLFPAILMVLVFFLWWNYTPDYSKIERIRSSSSPKASVEMKKARVDYFHRMLRDPATNEIPRGMRQRELAFAKTLPKTERSLFKPNQSTWYDWAEAGPVDVGGRTRALAVDVTNSNTIISGGVSGGIWKSTDNGATWTMKSLTADPLSVTSLVQDIRDGHTNVWYYAAGEFDGNSARDRGAHAFVTGSGIYKSINSGESWQILANTADTNPTSWNSPYDYVSRIVVSPTTGTILLASNGIGIYRSTDGGENFSLVIGKPNDHYYCDVVVATDGTVLAVLSEDRPSSITTPYQFNPGVYKSTNDGVNWTPITPASFPSEHERSVLATAPSNADILYVLTFTGNQDANEVDDIRFHKITVSTGASEDRSNNLPNFGTSDTEGVLKTQFNYNFVCEVKPNDPNFVLIGLTNLFRSRDGFATAPADKYDTWIGGYHEADFIYPGQHPDQHVIAFDPADANKMWVGHDGGLSYTTNVTAVATQSTDFPWIDKNLGYNVTQFYTVAISDNADDERIIGGTQDNGTPFFRWDGVSTTASDDFSSGDGAYAYLGDNYAYTSSQNGRVIRFGYDGSGNLDPYDWSIVTPSDASGQLFVNPFRIDPNSEQVMYYAAGQELWRNAYIENIPMYNENPTTLNWTNPSALAVETPYVITSLEVSRQPSYILYYGASDTRFIQSPLPPKIYRLTSSATATSGKVERSIASAPGGAYIHGIAVNPVNADEIMVVMSNYNIVGLYHSSDGGQNYTAVEGNLEGTGGNGPSLRTTTIVPTGSGSIYLVGTSIGLYSTKVLNGGSTVWTKEGTDVIGNVVVEQITSRDADDQVAVGTHGRGVFIGTRTPSAVEEQYVSTPNTFELEQNYPNPFNPSTTIEYTLPTSGHVLLKIYDVTGREVAVLVNDQISAGTHQVNFNAQKLPSGVYVYQLETGSYKAQRKLMVLK
jgi:hypothetical protein